MESCLAVEDIDAAIAKFTGLSEHADRVLGDVVMHIQNLKPELAEGSLVKNAKVQKRNLYPIGSRSIGKSKSDSKLSWFNKNSYFPQEIPDWQQPIIRFLKDYVNTSDSRKQINVITAKTKSDDYVSKEDSLDCDDNDEESYNWSMNSECDLEPLVEDKSLHKIDEYFEIVDANSMQTNFYDDSIKSLKDIGTGESSKNKTVGPNKENHEPMNISEQEVTYESVWNCMLYESIEKEVKNLKI